MHVEFVLAALVLVVAVLVTADFFRRTGDGPHEHAAGPVHDARREIFPASRAGSAPGVRPNWLVRTRLYLLAVVSAAAAVLATGAIIRAASSFQRASAHAQVSSMHDGAVLPAILALAVAVAILAAGLWSAMILIRSVLRPLDHLRAGAVELAETWLPDALRTISRTGGEGRPLAVKTVGVCALDEIGDVARAFDQVQGEVLRLAGHEAGLRGKLSEMFAELSGRGQALMDRQLQLIDKLGQDEHDAGRRASLIAMNRLAARMRRYSQNLLVLAGQELPGRSNRPVPLADVIRAAVAQTGERERVWVSVPPDLAVAGLAVNDVVYLVAELTGNAASLSATDTPVDISGGTLATGGVLVQVTDQGIGMSPEMMAKTNWWLEHPPPIDVAVSRHMGLFVVGRLAARHGIKVRLQPAATGGLTALVWLPGHVAVLPEALTGAASSAPVPEDAPALQPPVPWRLRALAPSRDGASAGGSDPDAGPEEDPPDGRRLPIYEAVESDWFSRRRQPSGGALAAGDGRVTPADTRWAVAKTVLAPASSGLTTAGLPLRAPRANLVPGAIGSPRPGASGPVRSADAARDRLAGFQPGASRGRMASGRDGQDPGP
jgi:signal transduction histidine kinase